MFQKIVKLFDVKWICSNVFYSMDYQIFKPSFWKMTTNNLLNWTKIKKKHSWSIKWFSKQNTIKHFKVKSEQEKTAHLQKLAIIKQSTIFVQLW